MRAVRRILDSLHPRFDKGGKWERLYPLYEGIDSFLFSPGSVTGGKTHLRDSLDTKRMMSTVIVALLPCVAMALWNTGFQANSVLSGDAVLAEAAAQQWRGAVLLGLGLSFDPNSFLANVVHGGLYFLPVYVVCNLVGGGWELVFCIVRRHELNEGMLVSGMLLPLTLPPSIPLWQVALGTSFGVVIGKEVFGGSGRNFLNPALTARAFLYFNNATSMVGDRVWVAVDGHSAATPLGELAAVDVSAAVAQVGGWDWWDSFLGVTAGSMGETSALACLFGAVVLIGTGIGSWRIMLSLFGSASAWTLLLNQIGSESNPLFALPVHWHWVVGGFAFGTVFMATDPVSAAMTRTGQWYYGALIGFMTILVRVINPAYPEGIMLAILFGNIFAPLIDYFVLQSNIRRRQKRGGEDAE
ncbi:MAG TPA: NADH:ubiquinone reductase (Na(+)-transporting) subunit B [Planctomycetaceae bacterium]|nr:NADH:ubiquinone reductase (Na(+)-transporting) subunit B [Planctomycetaceae bacterium]|tara:strand:- start:6139 stop:7377 length:1239 start_codon:yes stop_codon:yes gene_type:complete